MIILTLPAFNPILVGYAFISMVALLYGVVCAKLLNKIKLHICIKGERGSDFYRGGDLYRECSLPPGSAIAGGP